jgi:dTDP-4-dehydrorhamnose 3,5-epimerase-like enzyme
MTFLNGPSLERTREPVLNLTPNRESVNPGYTTRTATLIHVTMALSCHFKNRGPWLSAHGFPGVGVFHRWEGVQPNMSVVIEELKLHGDDRGSVLELLAPDRLASQRNVHVVLTEPGCARGNHFHKRGTETLIVYGPAMVRTREAGVDVDTSIPAGAVFRFVIPPGVSHAVRNTGPSPNLLIAFNTVQHDRAEPDAVADMLL